MANLSDYRFMDDKNHAYIRLLWFFVYVLFTSASIILILTLWREFMTNPTITTLESAFFPVTDVPFPGVALCEMNKFSRRRAAKFAQFLAARSNLTESEIMDAMPIFGKLYDFEYDIVDDPIASKIQKVLDEKKINLFEVFRRLSIQCDDFLKVCTWKGQEASCSEMFQLRISFTGFCCIFNYLRKPMHYYKTNITLKEPLRGSEGIHGGLTVSVANNIDDYLYTSLNSVGFTVLIFSAGDYPDQTSGGLSQFIAKPNSETFITLVPTTVVAVKEVLDYPPSKRQCLFDTERSTKLGTVYSQSDCHVECRVKSTMALCNCVPFLTPMSTKDNVCTLADLECLNRHKNKWDSVYPEEDTTEFLEREKHDSLRCSERCYPSCEGTSYQVFTDSVQFHNGSEADHDEIIVHVYYDQEFSNLYKHDVVYYWFEILSNFGGTFGLIIGMSIISLIECGVFWLQFFGNKCCNSQ